MVVEKGHAAVVRRDNGLVVPLMKDGKQVFENGVAQTYPDGGVTDRVPGVKNAYLVPLRDQYQCRINVAQALEQLSRTDADRKKNANEIRQIQAQRLSQEVPASRLRARHGESAASPA